MVISSKSNPLVKRYASLKEKKYRREYGEFLVEGVKMVREVFSSPLTVDKVIVSSSYEGESYKDAIEVSQEVFSYISDEKAPQGIMAVVKIAKNNLLPPKKNCLIVEALQDPGNLGTMIRTANAAGYKEIYLINCTDPFSPKCVRSAMSGLFFVDLYQGGAGEILSVLDGVPILAADMEGENIFSFNPPKKFALAIGNEGNGLSDRLFSAAEYRISIPMESTAESLNAGVSAGIAMYILKSNQNKNF